MNDVYVASRATFCGHLLPRPPSLSYLVTLTTEKDARWTHQRRAGILLILAMGVLGPLVRIIFLVFALIGR